jgi:hypothetical protein
LLVAAYGSAVVIVLIIRSLVGTFYLLGKNIHNRNNTAVSFVASWRISRIVAADGALVFANCRAFSHASIIQ